MLRQHRVWAGLGIVSVLVAVMATVMGTAAVAQGPCGDLPSNAQLRGHLRDAATGTGVNPALGPGTDAGGLFGGARMWGAIVNRQGEVCAFITSTDDPTQTWPISQAIAKAKAYTANSVSLDDFVLSTARLYTLVQPGHSLYGLNTSNPFNPQAVAAPGQAGPGQNQVAGGIITFGGGVPLYREGRIVGGLGVSGDTACADHEIAKRVRDLAGLNPTGGPLTDDIIYSSADGPSLFAHPLCAATKRNGVAVGDEPSASY